MLCEKNRCRGTLFEYELMHNFHYFFYVLLPLLPLTLLQYRPLPISTSARRITRKKYDVGGRAHGLCSSFLFPCCFPVEKSEGGCVGWVRDCSAGTDGAAPSRPSVFKLYPILPIKLFAELPALSELKQPSCNTPPPPEIYDCYNPLRTQATESGVSDLLMFLLH